MFTVIQEQTANTNFNSTIDKGEAVDFNALTLVQREEYLQQHFLSKGFAEGANNLINLAAAIREFGYPHVTTCTIYAQEIPPC